MRTIRFGANVPNGAGKQLAERRLLVKVRVVAVLHLQRRIAVVGYFFKKRFRSSTTQEKKIRVFKGTFVLNTQTSKFKNVAL
jgi:hypothetical protein